MSGWVFRLPVWHIPFPIWKCRSSPGELSHFGELQANWSSCWCNFCASSEAGIWGQESDNIRLLCKHLTALLSLSFSMTRLSDCFLQDLAVKIEGTFILRYRVFDLFSRAGINDEDATITAETYGGLFRVYSTRDFPGLPPSTDLTKVRVHHPNPIIFLHTSRISHDGAYDWTFGKRNERERRKLTVMLLSPFNGLGKSFSIFFMPLFFCCRLALLRCL